MILRPIMSTSSLSENIQRSTPNPCDAFNAVEDILIGLDQKQKEVAKAIESLPFLPNPSVSERPPTPSCHSKDLLLLKATSNSTVQSLETAFSLLHDLSSSIQMPVKIKNTGN